LILARPTRKNALVYPEKQEERGRKNTRSLIRENQSKKRAPRARRGREKKKETLRRTWKRHDAAPKQKGLNLNGPPRKGMETARALRLRMVVVRKLIETEKTPTKKAKTLTRPAY